MSHTHGPWRTGWLESYDAVTGEPLAYVYRLPPGDPEETAGNRICVRGSPTKMDCDADARLIAAAPELLEALEALAAFVEDDTCRHDHEKAGPLSQARAAISKARPSEPHGGGG